MDNLLEKTYATQAEWDNILCDLNDGKYELNEIKEAIIDTYNLFLAFCDSDSIPKITVPLLFTVNEFMMFSENTDEILEACQIYTKCLCMAIISPINKGLYKSGKIQLVTSHEDIFFDINQFDIDTVVEQIKKHYDF